ncbi:aromatic-L-amino-acid decarboxylase-like [Anoplophora glabripennis]|uniref:aromatic-L-amino-acid decarboxylase-like n=1 Tax=Anoplophora glabripennis TaxID=217634 RepID=UPI00087496D4|nr:aromatic-L-amino-acid decarboxylase-like [Anoplophora glabripennis]
MNIEEFREFGKASVDYIADYFENIRKINVMSNVEPGYLKKELPEETPLSGESWQKVLEDVDKVIVPGLTHWHSPNFHGYFPTANSFPGIVGELFLSGLGCISKDWETNPACVELEVRMMDWLGKILGLPEEFLNETEGPGGGIIQNAASEATLVGLLCGKEKTVKDTVLSSNLTEEYIRTKLVAYTSKESNSSVEKAGLLASVPMRLLPTDENGSLRGHTLFTAIKKDKESGLIPCCVVATLGTTGTCAFDNLEEVGEICHKEGVWLHIDAAYAGAAFACPEYRYLMKGVENVDSFNFNPHKWMLVNSDCSAMWFKDTKSVEKAFKVKSTLPKVPTFEPEIHHWQIPTTRRFRALKLWFVLRIYGVEGIQQHIRRQIGLAKFFEQLVTSDGRFEVCISSMGLVCFRLKGEDCLTRALLDGVSNRKKIFLMPYILREKLVVRFVICSRFTQKDDILFAWNEIISVVEEDVYPCTKNMSKDMTMKQKVKKKSKPSILKSLDPSNIRSTI